MLDVKCGGYGGEGGRIEVGLDCAVYSRIQQRENSALDLEKRSNRDYLCVIGIELLSYRCSRPLPINSLTHTPVTEENRSA